MNKGISTLLFLISLVVQAEATIVTPIDSAVVKRIELSSRFQNRIAVKDGRISQLVYPGCNLDINLDDEIGQVFIYALTNRPEPSSLTVITSDGKVQDFELVFLDKRGEIVILEDEEILEIDFEEKEILPAPGSPEYRVNIVKKIRNREVIDGFVCCDISPECVLIRKGVRAILVSKCVSNYETIYLWRVENYSKRVQPIHEMEMNFQCGNWVYLDQYQLCRGEQTFAIIGVKNEAIR